MGEKLRLYVDMDNVIVDFMSGVNRIDPKILESHESKHGVGKNLDEIEGVFALMDPIPGAIDAVRSLAEKFDTYVLSSSPWLNPSAWADKLTWIHKHFGTGADNPLYKRVILSHNKHLNAGDFLIDDRPNNGAAEFMGEWVHFGTEGLSSWDEVKEYMLRKHSEMN